MNFVIGSIKNVMDHGEDGACLHMGSQDPGAEDLLLSFPIKATGQIIVALSTAAHLAVRQNPARKLDLYQPLPIQQTQVLASPVEGRVSIVIQLAGGAFLPIEAPPEIARLLATELLRVANEVSPEANH